MKKNWQFRIIAILLAFFIWYLVSGQEKVETWVEIPVEMVNLPENLIIREGMISRINVRIKGPKAIVRGLNAQGIAYTMDLRELEPGTRVLVFDPRNISVNQPLTVVEIRPSRVELVVDTLVNKQVPVELNWKAELQKYYELKSKEIKPARVDLHGPETLVSSINKVQSQLVEIQHPVPRVWEKNVSLDIAQEIKVEPANVQVKLVFGPETKKMWVKRPIKLSTPKDKGAIKIDPQEIRLNLELPIPLLGQDNWREKILAELKVPEDLEQGKHQLEVELNLPADTKLIEIKPEFVEVIVPADQNATENMENL